MLLACPRCGSSRARPRRGCRWGWCHVVPLAGHVPCPGWDCPRRSPELRAAPWVVPGGSLLGLLASILLWDLPLCSHVRELQGPGARGGHLGAWGGPRGSGQHWGWWWVWGTLTGLNSAPGHVKWSCWGCHLGKEGARAWGCCAEGPRSPQGEQGSAAGLGRHTHHPIPDLIRVPHPYRYPTSIAAPALAHPCPCPLPHPIPSYPHLHPSPHSHPILPQIRTVLGSCMPGGKGCWAPGLPPRGAALPPPNVSAR